MINYYYTKIVKKLYSLIEIVWFKRPSFFIKKKTLLLLRLDSIGDYVLFRNFIPSLKSSKKYKNYDITLCGNLWWKELSENMDAEYISEFIWIDYPKMTNPKYRYKIYKKIHSKGFEILIHPSFSRDMFSDSIVLNSGAKEKIGYDGDLSNLNETKKNTNNLSYTKLIPSLSKYRFEFYRNLDFFSQLLPEKLIINKPSIDYPTTIEHKIIICPGAKDDFRRWSPKNFARLCNMLNKEFSSHEFIICGSKQDSLFAKEIIDNSEIYFSDLTGKQNLVQLVKIMAQARLVITNDSGPFHIAVALGKNVICLSNGNNYGRFSPYPKEMNTKSMVIYPPEVLSLSEEERLNKFCKEVKNININEINTEQVLNEIKIILSN